MSATVHWLVLVAALGVAAGAQAAPACRTILPAAGSPGASRRLVAEDLVRLRDIGPIEPEPYAVPFFTISPDGRRAAFQLRQADADANDYCLAMLVIDLVPGAHPRVVDEGGEILLLAIDNRGLADYPTGITAPVTPRWSPDGRWIAFLKRTAGTTQLWRAMADGSGSAPLTHSPDDVLDFRISADGSAVLFATRPQIAGQRRAIEDEAPSGYHFDDRFWPFAGNRPFARAAGEPRVQAVEVATGRSRAARPGEARLLDGSREFIATAGAPVTDLDPGLSIDATALTGGAKGGSFHARLPNGSTVTCTAPACEGATRPWWIPGHRRIRFYRREGWARLSTAIYEWDAVTGSVRRLYLTDDVLAGCAPLGIALICLRDSSLAPRRLERLDPATGRRDLLFDPNPEFARLTLGAVRRLYWRNAFGIESAADLVLPVGYRRGQRYPLVIVQYDTRGFLRGGTGDEYPIQAFANRGFAVLSFRRPDSMGDVGRTRDFTEARRRNLDDFADRRSVQSSLEGAVRLAVEMGVADPKRIGITGLSDGASTVTWALIHSSLFAAAAMSSCCIDTTLTMGVGPGVAKDFRNVGYPGMLERSDPFWTQLAFSANARRISTPILLQLADDEYLDALESYSSLAEAGAPIDMFVFPDEHHVKWQPAHRLAIYRRSLDWFDYWLRGVRSEAPERQAELEVWDRLRKAPPAH